MCPCENMAYILTNPPTNPGILPGFDPSSRDPGDSLQTPGNFHAAVRDNFLTSTRLSVHRLLTLTTFELFFEGHSAESAIYICIRYLGTANPVISYILL